MTLEQFKNYWALVIKYTEYKWYLTSISYEDKGMEPPDQIWCYLGPEQDPPMPEPFKVNKNACNAVRFELWNLYEDMTDERWLEGSLDIDHLIETTKDGIEDLKTKIEEMKNED